SWDQENRLLQITYSVGNNTQFTYDGLGRCVKIVENGTSPSYPGNATKQLLWCGSEKCEERDASNNVAKRFYALAQTISSTAYLYKTDHLGSIREMAHGTGGGFTLDSQYSYDPYGRVTKLAGTGPDADFGYSRYYVHSRSGLNLTRTRAYSANLGRFIS